MELKDKGFISIEGFWYLISQNAPAFSWIQELPPVGLLVDGLNQHFGNLTNHSVTKFLKLNIQLSCASCRNADANIQSHVCQSHLGVVKGTVECLTSRKVKIVYKPDLKNNSCLINVMSPSMFTFFLPPTTKL